MLKGKDYWTREQWRKFFDDNPKSWHNRISKEERKRRHEQLQAAKAGGDKTRCSHLREKRTNSTGVPITVPCGCTGETKEIKLPVYSCEVKKNCVPHIILSTNQLKAWKGVGEDYPRPESGFYQLCQICEHNPINVRKSNG